MTTPAAHLPALPRRRRPALVRSWAVAVALVVALAACGGDDGDDASGDGTTEPATETSAASDGAGAADEGDEDAGASEASSSGPVRDLPGLSAHADLTNAEVLQQVFGFPASVPVPPLDLARAYSSGEALASTSAATVAYGADYVAPDGDAEAVFAVVEPAIDASWTPVGEVEETSDGYFSRTYSSLDDEAASLTVVFDEAGEEVVLTARSAPGTTAAEPPAELWPWAAEVPAPPGATPSSWIVQIPDTGGGPATFLEMRWTAAPDSYDALAAYATGLPAEPLVAGEVTTSTDPFVRTDVDVTGPDDFVGQVSVIRSDPASDVTVVLGGTVSLEG